VVRAGGADGGAFVGRQGERAVLSHLLGQALDGRPVVAVITGPPGIGKTTLLSWLTAEGAARGAFVLRATASGTTLPFATVRRLLGPLPDIGAAAPGPDLARLAAERLIARARRRLLMVLLDDVHDLEPESLACIDELLLALDDAGSRHDLHLVAAVTARGPVEPDGLAERLSRLGAATPLALRGLDEHEVMDLLATWGLPPDRSRARQLVEDTGGLPLLVESAMTGGPRPGPGGATASVPRSTPRVVTLGEAIGRRIADLDGELREVLGHAALTGEPWEIDQLARVTGRPREEVATAVARAADAGLVRREPDGMRFAHPLVRSELLDRMGEDEQQARHRAIAERLAASSPATAEDRDDGDSDADADEWLLRRADHLLRGHPGDRAAAVVDVVGRAGRVALRWGAWHQASRFLSVAAEEGRNDDGRSAHRFLEAGRAAYLDHDRALGERLLTRAAQAARRAGDGSTRLAAATFLVRFRVGGQVELGRRIDAAELENALRGDPDVTVDLLAQARATLAEALLISGETDRALALVEAARGAARRGPGDPGVAAALARVEFAEGIHRLARLEPGAAADCLERGRAHAVAAGDRLSEVHARSRLALSWLMAGEVGRARDELVRVESLAAAERFWAELGLAAAFRSLVATLTGDDATAVAAIERANGHWRWTRFTYIAAALAPAVHALAGRTRGLGSDRSRPSLPSLPGGDQLPMTTAMAALAAVEAHDRIAARAQLTSARWRTGFRGPVSQDNGAIAVALVEVGDLVGDAGLVESAAPALEQMYARGALVVVGWPALVPRLLAVVARHRGDLGEARRLLDHAQALVDRERLEPERGRVLLERARVAAAENLGGPGAPAPTTTVAVDLVAAARAFARQSMTGWVARCDELAQSLGVQVTGVEGPARERTILTDDVVGSTAANAQLGDALYLEQLRIHDRIVRARLREHRGLEIKHTGDGVNVAFDDPHDAVRCALATLDDIRRWRADEPELALEIRCGLARGRLIPSGGDFFGLVQSQAARLCAQAAPGEVLATADVVEGLDAPDVRVESLGPSPLRGLPAAIEVFRLRPT